MRAIILFYETKGIESKKITRLLVELFGKMQKSNYGKYEYEVKGILIKGEYIKPVRAALIVKKKHETGVISLFEKYGIRYKRFEIIVYKPDFKK